MYADLPRTLYLGHDGCAAHLLNNIVTKTVGETLSIGNIHAVQTVLSLTSKRNQLMKAVRQMIDEELLIVYGDVPDIFQDHAQCVLQRTLLRTLEYVRGSIGNGWRLSLGSCKARRVAFKQLLTFCNGDLRHKRFTHIEVRPSFLVLLRASALVLLSNSDS